MGILSDIAGTVIGGVLGNKGANDAADKANAANEKINERNLQFAQNATKIRVDDMRNAGINPLLAANPGAAATAPQQIGAQKADVGGAMSSAASIGSGLFTKREQTEVAKTQVATQVANSAADIAKKNAEVENLAAQGENLREQNGLIREQAATQAASRAVMGAQTGMYSAQQAGTLLKNQEQQMVLSHWGTPQGQAAFKAGLDSRAGGVVGTGLGIGSVITNAIDKLIGPSDASAKRQQIDNEIKSGNRETTFQMPGVRVTKEK